MDWRRHVFLLTDIEGSTRLWEDHPDSMLAAVDLHDRTIRAVVAEHGGENVKTRGEGDSTFNVFADARSAVAAAVEVQRRLAAAAWPDPVPALRVRMGVHGGDVQRLDIDYHGPTVNRTARLRAAGHGGQVLVSGHVAGLLGDDVRLRDHGVHRLADLSEPEHIHEVLLGDGVDHRPLRTLETASHNLPRGLDTLIGRDRELQELRTTLRTDALVTLTGAGGSGKTRLATEVAAMLAPEFPDGTLLVELASNRTDSGVADAVADALGASMSGVAEPLEEVTRILADRRSLLVLDNCEHVREAAAAIVREIRGACPEVVVLATSQVPLRVRDERLFPLGTLDLPASDAVAEVAAAPATALFVQRAVRAVPEFRLDGGNAAAIASICRRVDGLPLAIELAAARVRHAGPDELDRQLDRRFRLLRGGEARAERHRTMHAAIDWSHALLEDDQRDVLHALGVFAGAFDVAAVDDVLREAGLDADGWDALSELVDRSLVAVLRDEDRTRYRLLESVREFVRHASEAAGTARQLRDAHLDWVLDLTDRGRGNWGWWTVDELRTAVEHALAGSRVGDAAVLVPRLETLLFHRGSMTESRRWLERVVAHGDVLPMEYHVECLCLLADDCHLLGDRAAAERWAAAAEVRLGEVDDDRVLLRAGTLLGKLAARRGDDDAAVRLWQLGLDAAAVFDEPVLTTNPSCAWAHHHLRRGEVDEARVLLEPLVEVLRDEDHHHLFHHMLWMLGSGAARTDLDRAERLFTEGLAWDGRVTSMPVWLRADLALVRALHDADEGVRLADEAIAEARDLGDRVALLAAVAARATVDLPGLDTTDVRAAIRLLQWCHTGEEGIEGALMALARAAARRGRSDTALTLLAAAERRAAPPMTEEERALVTALLDPSVDDVTVRIARSRGDSAKPQRLLDLGLQLLEPA